jgi:Ca2+/H+ antiporter
MFPTVLSLSGQETSLGELGFSRATSVILVIVYFAFLVFHSGDLIFSTLSQLILNPSSP